MSYWQFKFKEENWDYWKDMGVGEYESWRSPKTRNNKQNDIAIGDIVFLYRVDKKRDRGIYFVTEVSKVDFNNPEVNPIELKIIIDLKYNIFKPELFGFLDVIEKINKLDQRSTSYYKFDPEDNPQELHNQLISYQQDGNLVEDIKSIELNGDCSSTEKESLIKARIGQGNFRNTLIEYWNACSVTNYQYTEILIASHIKPWKDSTNEERLDVYNGLLLLPNIDKLFDKGYISFDVKGKIMLSKAISNYDSLGIDKTMKIKLDEKHHKYLEFHRESVFKK